MASRRPTLRLVKSTRSSKILALIPDTRPSSDVDDGPGSDDSEAEIITRNTHRRLSSDSSPAPSRCVTPINSRQSSPSPSIASTLERLNISYIEDSEDSTGSDINLLNNYITISDTVTKDGEIQETEVPALTDTTNNNCVPQELKDPEIIPPFPILTPLSNIPSVSTSFILDQIESATSTRSPRNTSLKPSASTPVTRNKRKHPANQPKLVIRKKKKFELNFRWTKNKFQFCAEVTEDSFTSEIIEGKTPLQYFHDFFSEDIYDDIMHNTNLYSVQEKQKSINVTLSEVKDFIAIHIMMGIIDLPSYLDYWAGDTRIPVVADIMTLKRFQQIRRYIHFVDNNEQNDDPYFKVRPVVEKVRQNCLAVEEESRFSIDEMVIPYKGTRAGKKRQYNPRKPRKWGFKNNVRAGVSGIKYDFFLYFGNDDFKDCEFTSEEEGMGYGSKAVLRLAKTIKNKPCVLYFDNYFSSLELIHHLREEYGIFSLGTMRSNRLRGADKNLKSDKKLKAQGRGAFSQTVVLSIQDWDILRLF